ncbi:MAG: GTP-binding protein [Promethearchaeota archaeon]
MVIVGDGRFDMPDNLFYSKEQHIYLDKERKLVGLDQIGYSFLKRPENLEILVEDKVRIGEPFATITTEQGITTLLSPCSGEIEEANKDALKYMENDTYNKGYILKMKNISEIDNSLITGGQVKAWAEHEVRVLLKGNYSFKVIEIGDSATGKTAIKVRFTDDYFKKDLKTTLGVDFGSKELNMIYDTQDPLFSGTYRFTAKINIWDAAGQAHYEKIRGMYYKDAKGALIVYDINNPVSFNNLDFWVNELEENIGLNIPVVLVGNKIDLERKVERSKAEEYAKSHGFLYYECSAKTGEGINELFRALALEMYKKEEDLD